jgi:hypothetical protein
VQEVYVTDDPKDFDLRVVKSYFGDGLGRRHTEHRESLSGPWTVEGQLNEWDRKAGVHRLATMHDGKPFGWDTLEGAGGRTRRYWSGGRIAQEMNAGGIRVVPPAVPDL